MLLVTVVLYVVKCNRLGYFDMCCSVHFCDNSKFCSQQMHTLYFVFVRHTEDKVGTLDLTIFRHYHNGQFYMYIISRNLYIIIIYLLFY
jgi:hypothetical protein